MIDQTKLYNTIIEAAKASKYGRDPGSNELASLTTFFKNVCNANPAAFLALLGAMIEHEVNTEPPQQITDGPKPGRLQ